MSIDSQQHRLTPATYPIRFDFETVSDSAFNDIQETVEQECNDAGTWKRLACRNVRKAGLNHESLFILEIKHPIEFEWGWEGARAFQPINMDAIGRQETHIFDSYLSPHSV